MDVVGIGVRRCRIALCSPCVQSECRAHHSGMAGHHDEAAPRFCGALFTQIASLTVRDAIVMKWSTDVDSCDVLGVARRNSTSIWSCRNSELSNLRSFEVRPSCSVSQTAPPPPPPSHHLPPTSATTVPTTNSMALRPRNFSRSAASRSSSILAGVVPNQCPQSFGGLRGLLPVVVGCSSSWGRHRPISRR